MAKRALFLLAAIRSHVTPAFYISKLLGSEYHSFFAVNNKILKELVEEQGHQAILTDEIRVGLGMERDYLLQKEQSFGRFRLLRSILRNEVLEHRINEIRRILAIVKPSIIFIDIFNSTDVLPLYELEANIPIAFINPMLSTHRTDGYPDVDQEYFPLSPAVQNVPTRLRIETLRKFLRRPAKSIENVLYDMQFASLLNRNDFSKSHPVVPRTVNSLIFDNIPEFILAPLELEFSPMVQKRGQHYVGLSIVENRVDTEIDPAYKNFGKKIIEAKVKGKKIIYCSFGTFYQGSNRILLDFLAKLVEALEKLENVLVVCSTPRQVAETLSFQRQVPTFVNMFTKVPQLEVLAHADLFITHGGLGSVKEGIFRAVPMIVYPLDLQYDQSGNALKVEYHGLGLRGTFLRETAENMRAKISMIINDTSYQERVRGFRDSIVYKSEYQIGPNDIEQLATLSKASKT